jgi:predicted XRE-type DNA-binding protein
MTTFVRHFAPQGKVPFSDLTQTEAGKILGIKQPHVPALMRNRSGTFSVERLMDFLTALGQDVEITVRPESHDAIPSG